MRKTSSVGAKKALIIALAAALAPAPAFAFYAKATCERNTATGALELNENGRAYVASWGMTYKIIAEDDRLEGYDSRGTPIPEPAHRPGWVTGICTLDAHTPKILEQPPTHYPPR